jgi:hypothetical protein
VAYIDKQAKVETEVPPELFDPNFQELVTKRDLEAFELKMEEELALLRWMLGVVLGGVLFLILKAFFVP